MPIANLLSPGVLENFRRRLAADRIDTCYIVRGENEIFRYEREPEAARTLHMVNSVTKSVLSVLIGIAIDRGELGPPQTPLSDYLPGLSAEKAVWTLEHLLTMSAGIDWPETGAWRGFPKAMASSEDWIAFILGRETIEPPGARMVYNSGASHLLSAALQRAVGMPAAAYARQRLFGPLGIESFDWPTDPQGIAVGGYGLRLASSDLPKLGRLMLQGGEWEGLRVVSPGWIERSTRPRLPADRFAPWYGYHWWVEAPRAGYPPRPEAFYAIGFGGQWIVVVPEEKLVATFTADLSKRTGVPLALFWSLFDRAERPDSPS